MIGRIGEQQFELLCAQAKLYCNKSSVDMMGWDFIVEFPMQAVGNRLTLDQRPMRSVRVQLKSTVGRSGSRVKLSLSAIDRLAKDPHPTVLVVFRISSEGKLQSGYLVHLIGENLGRILRRLRAAEARGVHDINHENISFDYEKVGTRFSPDSAGLLDALDFMHRQDPAEYTIEKQRQLVELGYEQGRFVAEAVVWLEGPEHLNDLLLGIAPLRPQSLKLYDNRFGIRLPYQGTLFDSLDEVKFAPPTLGPCEISIKGPGLGMAAHFEAEMFVGPPFLGAELFVRNPDFMVRLRQDGLKFETVSIEENMSRSVEQWSELVRALILLSSREAIFTISGNARLPAISLLVNQPISGPYLEQLPLISDFLEGWQRLLKIAGIRSTASITFDAFWQADNARLAVDILANPTPVVRLEMQDVGPDQITGSLEALYFNTCSFAEVSLSYCAKVEFERSEDQTWRYRSTSFRPLDVRAEVVDHEDYAVEQAAAHNLSFIINSASLTMTDRALRDAEP